MALLLAAAFFVWLYALMCHGGPQVRRWKP